VVVFSFKRSAVSFTNAKEVGGGLFRAAVPTTVTVETTDEDPEPLDFNLVMDLDVIDERLVCVRCEVSARPGGPPVTAEAMRRIPVARFLRQAAASGFTVVEVDPTDPATLRPFVPPQHDFADHGMTDDVLRDVARLYHWSLVVGEPPLGLLERDYGVPRGKASRWIATARRRGYVKDKANAR
jgi:hypothetical protein